MAGGSLSHAQHNRLCRRSPMQAVTIANFGDADVLNFGEVPTPSPRPGHVLIKIAAVGANYCDTLVRSWAVSGSIARTHMRKISAALMRGASGVQMGAAFVARPKTAVNPSYVKRLLTADLGDCVLTDVLSGRPARLLRHKLLSVLAG